MSLFDRFHSLISAVHLAALREDAETEDVMRSAIKNEQARSVASEAMRRNHVANGLLRDAVKRVRSIAVR